MEKRTNGKKASQLRIPWDWARPLMRRINLWVLLLFQKKLSNMSQKVDKDHDNANDNVYFHSPLRFFIKMCTWLSKCSVFSQKKSLCYTFFFQDDSAFKKRKESITVENSLMLETTRKKEGPENSVSEAEEMTEIRLKGMSHTHTCTVCVCVK